MYSPRELLAVALAAVLGLVLVAKPNAALRLQWFTFDTSSGRHGEWGNPDEEREFDAKWLWLVRAIGLLVLAVGAAILAVPVL